MLRCSRCTDRLVGEYIKINLLLLANLSVLCSSSLNVMHIFSVSTGVHNEKRSSYGRSIIVDPWGAIVASCPSIESMGTDAKEEKCSCTIVEGVGSICFAAFDREVLLKTRERMPVQLHRRPDVYYKQTDREV